MNNDRIFHLAINVTDLDRSIAFYELFGFKVLVRVPVVGEAARITAEVFGDAQPNDAEAALLRLGDSKMYAHLDLVEWKERPTTGRPYAVSNHTGIYRFSVHVDDPDTLLARLEQHGIRPLGIVGRLPMSPDHEPTTMFQVRDPDGIVVQVFANFDHVVS